MADDEIYEDDEQIKDLRSAWIAGDKGTTSGPHELSERAKFIVDDAVERLEARESASLDK